MEGWESSGTRICNDDKIWFPVMQISFWFSDSLAAKDSQMDNFFLAMIVLCISPLKVTSPNLYILIC